MDTKEMTTEHRLAHWSHVMRDRKESGMSINAYCEAAGFHENRYFYWQRKLRESACREIETRTTQPENALVPRSWTRVEASTIPAPSCALPIEIGAYRIQADANTDTELLAKICKVLASIYDAPSEAHPC